MFHLWILDISNQICFNKHPCPYLFDSTPTICCFSVLTFTLRACVFMISVVPRAGATGLVQGQSKQRSYAGRKEGRKVLFNDGLNTFYLRLYGVRHTVKDHSDSENGNPLPLHGLLFPISSKGSFICIIPQTGYYITWILLHQSWSTGWNEK